MMSRRRRLALALGIAIAWYATVFAVIYGLGALLGRTRDLEWLTHILLFPLGPLSQLVVTATELFGTVKGGEKQLPELVSRAAVILVPILHFAFVSLAAYGLVTWRVARRMHDLSAGRAFYDAPAVKPSHGD